MRRFNECVFDDMIYGTTAVFTGAQYSELLGSSDQRTIHALVSELGLSTTQLSIQIEQSPDGIHWLAKNATPEIDHLSGGAGPLTSAVGSDAGDVPGDGLARLRIWLTDSHGTPSAALRVYVTGRDAAKVADPPCACSPQEDADEPDEAEAYVELVQQAIDNVIVSQGPLMSFELALELEWARVLVAQLGPDEQQEALWAELGDDARTALLAAMRRLDAELESKRLTLVRGGKPRVGLLGAPPPRPVDPRAFARALRDNLEHEGPEGAPDIVRVLDATMRELGG